MLPGRNALEPFAGIQRGGQKVYGTPTYITTSFHHILCTEHVVSPYQVYDARRREDVAAPITTR